MNRKSWYIQKPGNLNSLELVQDQLPDPEEKEVQIQVKAVGLNFADIFAMQGLYPAAPKKPFIPGLEFSGEVVACGPNQTKWKIGDRVMGATRFGGYVSALNHHEDYLTALPNDWSFPQGAAFVVQGLTAYYGLVELGNLKENYTVLIHSAAGGVGILANRICKAYGAKTFGTVGSEAKKEFLLQQESYDEVIVRDSDFAQKLQKAKGSGDLNIVMECIGGKIFWDSYKAMSPMGRLITYGSASFSSHSAKPNWFKILPKYLKRPKLDVMRMPRSNKSVMGFNLIWLYDRVDILHEVLDKLMALQLKAQHVGHEFHFEQMPDAIQMFRDGKTMGKVVIIP